MADPLAMISPLLIIFGVGLLVIFGARLFRLVRALRRRARWTPTQAVVTDLSMKRGRGSGAARGGGVKHVAKFESEDSWRIRYTYVAEGQDVEGGARCHAVPPPPAGRTIEVHVDPERPRRSEYFDHEAVPQRLLGYTIAVVLGVGLLWRGVGAFLSVV